ncbi:MAG: hypothetical protein JRN20_07585 [Nitrososphaerota archaeon]|nr:hypothetical protein [Nitrososphaerota archaeon]
MTSKDGREGNSNFKSHQKWNFLRTALTFSVALVVASVSGVARALTT